jgi:uncharacterized protein YbaA (DUF1428 family)
MKIDVNLFFTIHYPHCLKRVDRLHRMSGNSFDTESTVENFQVFVARRLFPWVENVQHLLRIDDFTLQLRISGTVLELLQAHRPDTITALKQMASNRNVVFAETTYYHSICSLFLKEEYDEQLQLHRAKIETFFGKSTYPVKAAMEDNLPATVLFLARKVCSLEKSVKATNDETLLYHWRLLQDKTYYTSTHEALLKKHITDLEVLLLQKKLSGIRIRYPQHSFLL